MTPVGGGAATPDKKLRKQSSSGVSSTASNNDSASAGTGTGIGTGTDDNATTTSSSLLDDILQSISRKVGSLHQPQITITCYIPTNCVGAVIGRRGSTIVSIQRHAQSVSAATAAAASSTVPNNNSSSSVRVSIVGHEEENASVPYTYSDLDWSNPNWTPVVIRADPCAALAAAQRLCDLVEDLDDVVMDIPITRSKQAALVGKRGLVLANLSADTQVRIMVPERDLRHDVIQLEGRLSNVKTCLDRVLGIVSGETRESPLVGAAKANSNNNNNNNTATTNGTKKHNTNTTTADYIQYITISQLPPQSKLRSFSRNVGIQKKREEDVWQLKISGATADQVKMAIFQMQKWAEDNGETMTRVKNPNNNSNGNNNSNNRGGRGRGPGRGGKNDKSANKNRNKNRNTNSESSPAKDT